MSTFQLKYRSISAEPRLVMDWTDLQSLHAVDGFFQRAGNRHHHLVDRHHAVVNADDHAREIRGREHRHGNGECQVAAHECQGQNEEDNRF